MLDIWWIALIIGGVGCFWFYRQRTKFSGLPPGPKGWPLVGNALQQERGRPHLMWTKWAKDYGEVFTINNFGTPIVLCNHSKSIIEMLVTKSNDFAGRPDLYPIRYVSDGGIDVPLSDFDAHWAYRKKLFMTNIKSYGDGLEHLENIMSDVIAEFLHDFRKTNQEPFDPLKSIRYAIANTLVLLLLGDKFEKDDPEFLHLLVHLDQFDEIISPSMDMFLLSTCPWLHYLPLPYCKLMDNFFNGFVKDWLPKMIHKKKALYDENVVGCILDAFLKQHETDMKTNPQNALEMRHVVALCSNMFTAGMLTTSATMYTMLAILTVNPEIQAKLQTEIDQVLGGCLPKLQDKQSMPYFQATLEEVFRYAIIVNGFVHQATTDSSICGYHIPKGTQVWPNVWHLCHDPDIYEDPWTFKPERFLDDNGNFLPVDHPVRSNVMVFGAGRRVCAGEQLGRNRIFLLTTSLLQNFVLEPGAKDLMPQSDPRTYPPTVVVKPMPYKIKAKPRG